MRQYIQRDVEDVCFSKLTCYAGRSRYNKEKEYRINKLYICKTKRWEMVGTLKV